MGRAVEVTEPAQIKQVYPDGDAPDGAMHLFRLDVDELVLTRVQGDDLVVDAWRAGRGAWQVKRR